MIYGLFTYVKDTGDYYVLLAVDDINYGWSEAEELEELESVEKLICDTQEGIYNLDKTNTLEKTVLDCITDCEDVVAQTYFKTPKEVFNYYQSLKLIGKIK